VLVKYKLGHAFAFIYTNTQQQYVGMLRRVSGKESASGVATDDPTDKSEDTSSFFQPSRHDLLPLILGILAFTLGLTAALLSFFLLKNGESDTARNSLVSRMDSVKIELGLASSSLMSVIAHTAALFQVSKTSIDNAQFEGYTMASGSLPKYLIAVNYAPYVPIDQVDSFVQSIRATGGVYSNFTVSGRDSNNQIIPPVWTYMRCPITQTVPTNLTNVLGYDLCTNHEKNATIHNSIRTRAPTVTAGILSSLRSEAVALNIMTSIFNTTTNKPTGMVFAVMILSDMIEQALSKVLDGFDVAMYDYNVTDGDKFLYSTCSDGDYSYTSTQNNEHIANSPFTYSSNTTFGDRVYQLMVIPGENYLKKYDGNSKYIALAVSLVIMLVLIIACVFLYFTRKLLVARRKRGQANIQIDLLKTNQTALRTLLDRIATQEAKTRAVINALPDIVCVISPTGKILQTNSAFDEEFPYTQQEMEKGVYSWDVFTELAADFFRVCDDRQEIETHAQRRFGDVIEVIVRVRDLRGKNESSNSQSNENKHSGNLGGTTTIQLPELEEAYVIIAKYDATKSIAYEVTAQEKVKRHEFEKCFRDRQFREDLKLYCEKNQNVENILFLEQVKEYKKAQFGVRVDMKVAIYERFIKPNSPMQLNLANEVVIEESIKINKSMGDISVFKNVEELIVKILANDIYPRYLLDQRKGSAVDLLTSQQTSQVDLLAE
jgi:PAS domain S-box-containing protein